MDGNIRTDDAWRFRDRLLNPDGTVVKTIKKSTLIWKTTVVKESKRTDKKTYTSMGGGYSERCQEG